MASESNVDRFRRLIERGFSAGELEVVDQVVAPDCVEHQRGNKPGREGVRQTITTLRSWFSDFDLAIDDMVIDGNMIWSRNVATGINTGSVMGHPPTGRPLSVDVIDIARFEDGTIVEHWGVADQLGMMLQLGLVARPQRVPAQR